MRIGRSRKPLVTLLQPYILIAPTLALVLMFNVLPAFRTVNDSLYKPARGLGSAGKPPDYVGLQNFVDLFDDSHYMGTRFLRTVRNTIVFALATVVIGVPLGLTGASSQSQAAFSRRMALCGFLSIPATAPWGS